MLKTDSATSTRSHGKLTYFMYIHWPQIEAELSILEGITLTELM
jgi:hypothetical protein